MKKSTVLTMLAALMGVLVLGWLFSCGEKVTETPTAPQGSTTSDFNSVSLSKEGACGTTSWDLTAGQTIDVGSVTVENDADNLYVTYTLDYPGACFGTLHLWVGDDLANVPKTPKGIPIPGQFPYHFDATGETEYTFTIPLTDVGIDLDAECENTLYVVPHAEVDLDCNPETNNNETAFGGDTPGGGPRWWFYGVYTTCCPDDGGEECRDETAFGGDNAGATDCQPPAWWFYFDTQGEECQAIYAGQQLMVGGSVCYDADNDVLTITLGPGWSLDDGTETVKVQGYDEGELPTCRPAAGQFTSKGTSLTVEGDGSLYYVIHLDVKFCE